ncbi:MAG: YaiI/YqxD family protein [Myxococcales bacterium]|nr:YaiI/YqxD family protein [Myxococcales bacterium]USN50619.1 MAG: YaiI/YqxD family protein [Myxococcales bacterium]
MKIWIDADACPNVIKEIVYRASFRTNTAVVVVANQAIKIPMTGLVSTIQVSQGFDMADKAIVEKMSRGDIVISADIPLANDVIAKGGYVINPRGELYTEENIKDHLATRDLMMELRDSGMMLGGPKTLGLKERQAFANKLDSLLAMHKT